MFNSLRLELESSFTTESSRCVREVISRLANLLCAKRPSESPGERIFKILCSGHGIKNGPQANSWDAEPATFIKWLIGMHKSKYGARMREFIINSVDDYARVGNGIRWGFLPVERRTGHTGSEYLLRYRTQIQSPEGSYFYINTSHTFWYLTIPSS